MITFLLFLALFQTAFGAAKLARSLRLHLSIRGGYYKPRYHVRNCAAGFFVMMGGVLLTLAILTW